MTTKISLIRKSVSLSLWQHGLFFIALASGCFALAPQVRAICQEGCLPSNNTVLGENALISNANGLDNTAIGFLTLLNNTTGGFNTAIGARALSNNTTGSSNIAIGNSAGATLTTGNDNIDIGN